MVSLGCLVYFVICCIRFCFGFVWFRYRFDLVWLLFCLYLVRLAGFQVMLVWYCSLLEIGCDSCCLVDCGCLCWDWCVFLLSSCKFICFGLFICVAFCLFVFAWRVFWFDLIVLFYLYLWWCILFLVTCLFDLAWFNVLVLTIVMFVESCWLFVIVGCVC